MRACDRWGRKTRPRTYTARAGGYVHVSSLTLSWCRCRVDGTNGTALPCCCVMAGAPAALASSTASSGVTALPSATAPPLPPALPALLLPLAPVPEPPSRKKRATGEQRERGRNPGARLLVVSWRVNATVVGWAELRDRDAAALALGGRPISRRICSCAPVLVGRPTVDVGGACPVADMLALIMPHQLLRP